MTQDNPRRSTSRPAVALLAFFCAAALASFLLSLPSYTGLVAFLSARMADGSFESLSSAEYAALQWVLRGKALLLLGAALFLALDLQRGTALLRRFSQQVRAIHPGRELRGMLAATFPRPERGAHLALAGITLAALATRLIEIDRPVGYDEAYTFIHFASRPLHYIITDYSAPNNHILHSLLVALCDHLFGSAPWTLRLPALLAGVLTVPAVYMAGRALYDRWAGLLAGLLVAAYPMLVDYSTNARGYTLMCLLSCLLLWAAAVVRRRPTLTGWSLLALIAMLGFYNLPVMVYPVCGVFLWLLLSWLFQDTAGERRLFLASFTGTSLATIAGTLLLYLPVIVFGSGLASITGNKFVQSMSWQDFTQDAFARAQLAWEEWHYLVPGWFVTLLTFGFLLLVVLEWRQEEHRFPPWLPQAGAIVVLLSAQRVAPLPRVWMFLLVFFLLWAAAGWTALAGRLARNLPARGWAWAAYGALVAGALLAFLIYRLDPGTANRDNDRIWNVARYVAQTITPADTLVAVSPVSVQVGYYLTLEGVPFDRFYNRDRPQEIQHALLILGQQTKFPTVDAVLSFQQLQEELDGGQAQLLYNYSQYDVYAVPARP